MDAREPWDAPAPHSAARIAGHGRRRQHDHRWATGARGQAAADHLLPLLGQLWMRAGTAVPVLPFPATGTDLTGQKMASRQATAASSVFRRPEEKDRHPSCFSVSLCEWQAGPSGQQVPRVSATGDLFGCTTGWS
jgi:hypothetical protein